jgi:hypothetical protein
VKSIVLALALLFSAQAAPEAVYVWGSGTTVPVELVQRAAIIASKLTRYPVPQTLPVAHVLTDAEMDAIMPDTYGLVAYRDPSRILLNVNIPSDRRFAVLVHEMVHVMQSHAGRVPFDCHTNAANELEAYSAAMAYLTISGNTHIPLTVHFSCP